MPAATGLSVLAFVLVAASEAPGASAPAPESITPRFDRLERGADADATYIANELEILPAHVGRPWLLLGSALPSWCAVRGAFRYRVAYDDFFAAMGREDLAASWRSRRITGEIVYFSGLAALFGGVAVAVHGFATDRNVVMLSGLGAMVGGYVAENVGMAIQKPGISGDEAVSMARQYNGALLNHLHLGGPPPVPSQRPGTFALLPLVTPLGLGMVADASF